MVRIKVQQQAVVEPEWLLAHLHDPGLRVVEVDVEPKPYDDGHIDGAAGWLLHRDLEDPVRRDVPTPEQMAELLGRSGIGPDTTIVLYGDGNNRSATWAFWVLTYYRHKKLLLLNGGRTRWHGLGLPLTKSPSTIRSQAYPVPQSNSRVRAQRTDILRRLGTPDFTLVDVRTPAEYRGEDDPTHPQTGIVRLGHIPGAVLQPWDEAVTHEGAFRSIDQLRTMYDRKGVRADTEVVVYCRLGVRASYTWFVLRHLLGYPDVRNYDGSWTEWGNLIGVPVERGAAQTGGHAQAAGR